MLNPMKKLPKILYVIGSMDIGGTEMHMFNLITHLHGSQYKCHVFSLIGKGPLSKRYKEMGVPLYSGGLNKEDVRKAPWKLLHAQNKLLRVTAEISPLIIHGYLPLITFMSSLCGRIKKIPLVITSKRGLPTHQKRYPALKFFDMASDHLSHLITVNCKAVLEETVKKEKVPRRKLVLIYNGVDYGKFQDVRPKRSVVRRRLGIQDSEKVVIAIGNLIPYKGHKDLIRAANIIKKEEVEGVRFLIVGEDRGMREQLENMAEKLGVRDSIFFLGLREDIPELLAASDISVLPSYEEGFSNVILESMAAGLPVVATKVGGNPEAVVDGHTGWIAPPGDHVSLGQKLLDLIKDENKARAWGEKGREIVKSRFSMEKMVEAYLRLYHNGMIRTGP